MFQAVVVFSFNTSFINNKNIQKYSNSGQENVALPLRLLRCVLTSLTSQSSAFQSFCSLIKRQRSVSNIPVVSYTVCLLLYYKTQKMKPHKPRSLFHFYVCKPFARSWPRISREYLLKSDLSKTTLPMYKQLDEAEPRERKALVAPSHLLFFPTDHPAGCFVSRLLVSDFVLFHRSLVKRQIVIVAPGRLFFTDLSVPLLEASATSGWKGGFRWGHCQPWAHLCWVSLPRLFSHYCNYISLSNLYHAFSQWLTC